METRRIESTKEIKSLFQSLPTYSILTLMKLSQQFKETTPCKSG